MCYSVGWNVINQFFVELDGVEYNNEGVLVLVVINVFWYFDFVFCCLGCFDCIIFVLFFDVVVCEVILKLKFKGKLVSEFNYSILVKKIGDFFGADLEVIIDWAIEGKLVEVICMGIFQFL